jgi:hypothetical protein
MSFIHPQLVWCGVVLCCVVLCGVVWCGVVWCGVVWCGVVWCGVVWCGVALTQQSFVDIICLKERVGVGWGWVGWGGLGWGGVEREGGWSLRGCHFFF